MMLGRKVIGWICPCYEGLRSVFEDWYLERLLACNENERLATVDAAYWRVQASGYRIIGVDGDVVETRPRSCSAERVGDHALHIYRCL
jgi:hypothetical protein